ncbi:MAG: hypothetical protein D6B25_14010, partial [Desulfobulbaceae bacterium]
KQVRNPPQKDRGKLLDYQGLVNRFSVKIKKILACGCSSCYLVTNMAQMHSMDAIKKIIKKRFTPL